ncbi:hypothetical protein HMI56_002923 [Coelomomyces lativittatus]|nr:hypothetical protein HMI56_002923 [Coelomomyces lativittatus]
METTLDQVHQHCQRPWQEYQTCLLKASNPKDCHRERTQLQACTDLHVPLLRELRIQCQSSLQPFQKCVQENPQENPASVCATEIHEVLNCLSQHTGKTSES